MSRPMPSGSSSTITIEEMESFCEYFYRRTGIRLDAARRYFLDRRLEERISASGASSLREYTARLKLDASGSEMQFLINEMTVNETYFFREEYQFDALVRHMLDEVVVGKHKNDRIKIWSIPCSTGEEPYSLAIWMLEHWGRADDFEIEIHASDIDSRVLARSREGLYEERAVHRVSPALRQTYFDRIGADRWQVKSALRQSIEFSLVNVGDPTQMQTMKNFDVIFCRNLLIYFDDMSRRRTAEQLYDALLPGGFVCLGHSESMSRISNLFVPRKYPEALVHQRPRS